MNGILAGKAGEHMIPQVIPADRIEVIRQHMQLSGEVIGLHNIAQHKAQTRAAEVIWTTWGMESFTPEQIEEYFPNLKAVFYCAGSVQHFARPFLERGIRVFSAWGANAVPVSEFTLGTILLSAKGVFQAASKISRSYRKAGDFSHSQKGAYRSTVGLIGLGMIGGLVAEKLKPLDFNVLAFDPFASAEKADRLGVRLAGLEEIFCGCDIISNHLADKPETRNMLNYALFSKMKPYATFINTARGAQVVEKELARALREVKTRTAVLDVTVDEPVSLFSPLRYQKNIILTPHIAGSSGNEFFRMADYLIEDFLRFSRGEPCRYEVTLKMLETMA
jgi:phosphoglycerate dehydrogenase-like enzyme